MLTLAAFAASLATVTASATAWAAPGRAWTRPTGAWGMPLPPPRPALDPEVPVTQPTPGASPAAPPAPDPAPAGCLAELRQSGVVAEPASQPGTDVCQIEEPVRLSGLAAADGRDRRLTLPDRPVVSCRFALSFVAWAGRAAAPILAARRGSPLIAIRTGPGFECRGRNRQEGAKLSAHATGTAIDVAGFDFADGSRLDVEKAGSDAGFATVRTAACGWFTTVLGPGSDAYHNNHLHLDVMVHGRSDRYRICQ